MSAQRKFLASYQHDDDDWSLEFYATDEKDAARKITSIRRTLSLDGEIAVRIGWFPWINFGMFKRKP